MCGDGTGLGSRKPSSARGSFEKRAVTRSTSCCVGQMARRGDDQAIRRVALLKPGLERFARERRNRFGRAENRLAERVRMPEILREQLVDQVLGIVLGHADFFQHHGLLALDVFLREFRLEDHIRKDVEGLREMLVEDAGVEADHFLGGEGVEHAAERSISRAMSSAVRRWVPLNTMCSMKCEMPLSSSGSRRDPERSQMPTETEWTCSIGSVRTTRPFGRISLCTRVMECSDHVRLLLWHGARRCHAVECHSALAKEHVALKCPRDADEVGIRICPRRVRRARVKINQCSANPAAVNLREFRGRTARAAGLGEPAYRGGADLSCAVRGAAIRFRAR